MRIQSLQINGLFDVFNHHIRLSRQPRVTIIIGPNGYGKTTILEIINALFQSDFPRLERLPFQNVQIEFDNEIKLQVSKQHAERSPSKGKTDREPPKFLHFNAEGSNVRFEPYVRRPVLSQRRGLPLGLIAEYIPNIKRAAQTGWYDAETGTNLEIEEVLTMYGHQLPRHFREMFGDISKTPVPHRLRCARSC